MKKSSLALVVLCGLVLGLTWLASRALTAESPGPDSRAAPTPPTPTTRPPRPLPTLDGVAPSPEDPARGSGSRDDVARVQALGSAPVEMAESPFATERSAELDYAATLVFGPDAGPATWRNAAEVFERCLKQVPNNPRCYRGLVAAQERLAGLDSGVTAADLAPPVQDDGTPRKMLINPSSIDVGVPRPIERRE